VTAPLDSGYGTDLVKMQQAVDRFYTAKANALKAMVDLEAEAKAHNAKNEGDAKMAADKVLTALLQQGEGYAKEAEAVATAVEENKANYGKQDASAVTNLDVVNKNLGAGEVQASPSLDRLRGVQA